MIYLVIYLCLGGILFSVLGIIRNAVIYSVNIEGAKKNVFYDDQEYYDRYSYGIQMLQIHKWTAKQFYPKYKDRF